MCYEKNATVFFACKARDPNPPRKFFPGANFFSTAPLDWMLLDVSWVEPFMFLVDSTNNAQFPLFGIVFRNP